MIVPSLVLGALSTFGCDPSAALSVGEADDSTQAQRTAQSARPPSMTKIDPASIIVGADGELTITGKGFVPGLSVTVGGVAAPAPRTVTATKIQVSLPTGLPVSAAVSVQITNPDGRSSARSDLLAIVTDPIALTPLQPESRTPVSQPRPPVVADFNGDGRPDVALLSLPAGSLVVQLNTAAGAVVKTSPLSTDVFDLFAGDLNADGKADLVVTSLGTQAAGVMLGNGDGTFQPVAYLASAGAGFSNYQNNQVDIGDLNADGKVDLVIGDVGGTLFYCPGNGDGTFAAPVNLTTTTQPLRAVRLADLDGVPGLEVVAAAGFVGGGGGTLVAATRKTDGTFNIATNTATTDSLYALAVVDYDNDGKRDAVVLGDTGKLLMYHGNGDATFALPVASPVPGNGSFLLAADLNGDNKVDFITGGRTYDVGTYPTTTVSLGNGDGTVRSAPLLLDSTPQHTGGALLDINGDGKLDLALSGATTEDLQLLAGRGDGTFISNGSVAQATAVTLGDFNGDGRPDLAYVGSGQNKLAVALGDGGGTYGMARTFDVDKGPSALATGDFNGDGKLDVAVSCYDTNLVSLLLGNGDGSFAPQRTFSVGKGPNALVAVDLDGDGKLDLITANTDSDNVSVLLGNGTGNFATSHEYAAGKAPSALAIGDLNADGKVDVVTSNADSGNIAYLQGGTMAPGTLLAAKLYTTGTTPSAVAVGDVNGDGKLDVITANSDSSSLGVHVGRGDGTFAAARFSTTCDFPTSVAVADLSGDGKLDAVVQCASSKRSQALIGGGDGGFSPSPRVLPLGTALTLFDVNTDGKPDVVIPDSGNPLNVFLNTRK